MLNTLEMTIQLVFSQFPDCKLFSLNKRFQNSESKSQGKLLKEKKKKNFGANKTHKIFFAIHANYRMIANATKEFLTTHSSAILNQ